MIIGLGGKIKSGKSEAAKYLSEKYKLPIIPFARGVKDLVTSICGLDDSHKGDKSSYEGNINFGLINSELKKYSYPLLNQKEIDNIAAIEYHDKGGVYRLLLQYVGTDIFRSRNDQHWINKLIETASKYNCGFICDDVRFPNEHNAIKHRFNDDHIITIKVVNPNDVSTDSHESEILFERIQFDVILTNLHDGKEKYYSKIDGIFKNVRIFN